MRFARAYALAASTATMAGAIVFAHQDSTAKPEPKAEDVFKSIKSFKGKKASELMPAMHFMSQSLGTDCSFCHLEGKFEDESKHEKEAAREMIEMTKKLNDEFFGGRNQITCNSCHNGRTHPNNTASAFFVSPRLRDTSLVAKTVFENFTSATKAPTTPSTLVLEGTVTHQGKATKLTTKETSNGKFMQAEEGGITISYNGQDAYYKMGGVATLVPPPDNTALIRYGQAYWAGLPALESATAGKENMDGKSMNVVAGKMGTASVKFFFDPASNLLVRAAFFETSILGRMVDGYDFADYKDVNGTMVPMTVTHHESATRKTIRKYTKVTLQAGVTDADFGK